MFITSTLMQVGWHGWWVPLGWGLFFTALAALAIWLAADILFPR